MSKTVTIGGRNIGELALYVALLLATGFLIRESYEFNEDARLVPLLVLSILLILLVVRSAFLLGDELGVDLAERFAGSSTSITDDLTDDVAVDDLDAGPDSEITVARELKAIGWVTVFAAAFYVFGIVTPMFVLLLAFVLVEYDGSKLRAALVALAFSSAVYVLFVAILDMRVYEGLIPIGEGILF